VKPNWHMAEVPLLSTATELLRNLTPLRRVGNGRGPQKWEKAS
jgi:hypothetical protein